ncbi:glycosyltransferase [Azospirillum sp.]|uniref:glycosyltransferase n=1 Tax=Azospirillum sp. TaxID=34012 RepID=UPI003D71565F
MTQIAVLRSPEAVAAASLHALGGGFLLAVWESHGTDAPHNNVAGRITPSVNGGTAPLPYTTLTVRTSWGSQRSYAVLRWPGGRGTAGFHDQSGHLLAEAQAGAGLPDFDPALLLGGLDAPARLRVARLILDFCRSTGALKQDAGFVAACRRVVHELSPRPSTLAATALLTDTLLLCEGGLSASFGAVLGVVALTGDTLSPVPVPAHVGNAPDSRGRLTLHLVIERALARPETLVVLIGRNGLACRTVTGATAAQPTLLEHLEQRRGLPAALRQHLTRCLAERGRTEAAAGATAYEMQVLLPQPKRQLADPDRPVGAAVDVAVPTPDGGLFLAGWVHDPHSLTAGLTVVSPFGEERTLDALPHRFPREDVAKLFRTGPGEMHGFAAFLPGGPEPGPSVQVRCELRLGGGGKIALVPPPSPSSAKEACALVLGSVPPAFVTNEVIETVLAPAVAPLHAAHLAARTAPTAIRFGTLPERPAVSVIIPLYRNLEFLRFQLGAFATDPAMAGAELIFVLDSPEQAKEVEHALRGLHGLYGLPMLLLINGANHGYSAANNAGVAVARGKTLLFLNSDVVPDRPGWLPQLSDALDARPATGMVGPKLLFDDESLQHAGLLFQQDFEGRWYNHHYFKGMPRDFAPATVARAVPGVTGACLMMPKALFERVGGFTEDYVIGDYEDSDLCLKVRSAGREIRYVPEVELYHLERQSITRNAGYTRGVAAHYNRWLHAGRWSALMSDLMSRDWAADDAAPTPSSTPVKHKKRKGRR